MSVIFLLIGLSLLVAGGFLAAFVWAVRSGQYEDTGTPALRVLAEEPSAPRSRTAPACPPQPNDRNRP
ncbi:cbb3-type cytochrome oxidase assembly protein CcoS [Limisphaera sp. VF-2]|jgi:cbb3-type cytochrome oxidase maturation protein|uniref:cbb3-type cytochrome oxidase assembly protein CcoS n=1 Tax=Limisphaera sp. VF-2 TaxID=3400418 RepID=UPI001776A505|nr:cbb3-type cytochrome oxidase assembly protein CcoS [Limisphaera sp.]